jgi:hypothetical protein
MVKQITRVELQKLVGFNNVTKSFHYEKVYIVRFF